MVLHQTAALAVLALVIGAGCTSAPVREGESVVQFLDIRNDTGEPVTVTARVGASPEQRLGFFEPTGFRRVELATGAATTGTIFLRARNPETGREATQTLEVSPGRTLEWTIRF